MSLPRLAYSDRTERRRTAELTDRELLAALTRDDELALDELMRRKAEPLASSVLRILGDREEAKDVVQVAFLRMWDHRHDYDPKWSPNTWIYRIAGNLAIDHLRSRRSRERHHEPYRLHLTQVGRATESPRGLEDLQQTEVAAIFHELASGLTEKQRLAFLLREVEGMSSKEVADIMECRESTVRNHVFNARKTLQRELRGRYPEYAASQEPS